ncbi:hypothetical protein [Breoghania sp.]|uniref:hypothetical protein n=1 Tax=Breoghania sp. TaxID=2065378 RepID=UPI0029CA6AB6|nr:hypothetical protein [Breoghania sp.]
MTRHHPGGAGIVQIPQFPAAFKRTIDSLTAIPLPAKLLRQFVRGMVPTGENAKGALQGFGLRWACQNSLSRSVITVHYHYTFCFGTIS